MSAIVATVRRTILRVVVACADRVLRRPEVDDIERREPAPVLVVTPVGGGFARYYEEILVNEGWTSVDVVEATSVDDAISVDRLVVIVGAGVDDENTATALSRWVERGGSLVAMRPSRRLAHLLGLERVDGAVEDGYVAVVADSEAGGGIAGAPMQVHGVADRWLVRDASVVARLHSTPRDVTAHPAVTMRRVGRAGGWASAFTYDLAESVVLTRQGNPAWSGQNRDGDILIRSDDLFVGDAVDDPRPDWLDDDLLGVPQADEQQRLLANVVTLTTRDRIALPRFWYLPHGKRAAVVMTGDDHGGGGTVERFERYAALDAPGANVDDWECVRATSYVFPLTPIPWRKLVRFVRQGFEVALHVSTDDADWTPSSLRHFYAHQLPWFRNRLPFAGPPQTIRTHCVTWSDYDTQPEVEIEHGIRLDTNYYFYPPRWVRGRGGHFTGSGLPMRFADRTGRPIDVFQAPTQITDESAHELPIAVESMLDAALGPDAFVCVVTVNAHMDFDPSGVSDEVLGAALARRVPVIAAQQLLRWLDARNAAVVEGVRHEDGVLRFDVRAPSAARGLQLLVPVDGPGAQQVREVSCDGDPIAFSTETFKGIRYARIPARSGAYEATYGHAAAGTATTPGSDVVATHDVISHSGEAELLLGSCARTVVSPTGGGEVMLAPAVDLRSPTTTPAPAGYAGVAGALHFDLGSTLRVGVGGQVVGAAFEADADGGLHAVTWRDGRRADVTIAGTWAGADHRYQIDREGEKVRFWLDASDVALLDCELPDDARVLVDTDSTPGRTSTVSWVRVLPFEPRGSYTSPVVEATDDGRWGEMRWTVVHAQTTRLDAEVRFGTLTGGDVRWSPWVQVPRSGTDLARSEPCLQYRFTLSTEFGLKSPALRRVDLQRVL